MSRTTYNKPQSQETPLTTATVLPTDKPIAIYYRQSTDAQIGNVSTTIQTVDMVKHLKQCGWTDDNIIMIDMDAGISGTTSIDERQGMKMLFDMIMNGSLGAVACQDEDRLFRDVTQIQVNIFIDACKTSNVLVVTPSVIYDFAHPQMGTFHARQFRFKSEMSAEYISSYIKGRLHRAKRRIMMEGKWAGGSVPLGYMVDERKKLASGVDNPNYRKYAVYEPFAEIIREYFRLFIERNGNWKGTARYIIENGSYFPDVANMKAPEGFRFVGGYTLKNYGNGYCPASGGLAGILTNAAYLGHWKVNGVITIWNNHEPIVSEDVFMQAFNYLSPTALTGEPNKHYINLNENARPTLEKNRPVEKPLLSGMIFTEYEGKWLKGRTSYVGKYKHYAYNTSTPYPIEQVIWWKKAVYLDKPLIKLLREKLQATFDDDKWEESLAEYEAGHGKELVARKKHLATLERTMENLIASLDTIDIPSAVAKIQERYKAAEAEHSRLSRVIAQSSEKLTYIETVKQLRKTYATAFDTWDDMTRDRKRNVLHAFIKRVVVSPLDNHGLHVLIEWRDETTNELRLAKKGTTFTEWLAGETRVLLKMVKEGATQVEIAFRFSNRTWQQIYMKIYTEIGEGYTPSETPIRKGETYADYLKRVGSTEVPYKATAGKRWSESDVKELKALIERGATQIEIAQAFPHRKWNKIRLKIRDLIGKGIEVPDSGHVGKYETYYEYEMRLEREKDSTEKDEGGRLVSRTSENKVDVGRVYRIWSQVA